MNKFFINLFPANEVDVGNSYYYLHYSKSSFFLRFKMCHNLGVFIFFIVALVVVIIMEKNPFVFADALPKFQCPDVQPMKEFNIFKMLGPWFVAQYYSSSEEALTYTCMSAEFGLSSGNMDMRMQLKFRYANDPDEEMQTGNMTWQIPDPRRPEHWRHTEDHYLGIYNTDVIDTDYDNWLLLLHCSDLESDKKFLSSFVLSRTAYLDKMTTDYLREKIGYYSVELDYMFPVNQTHCEDHKAKVNVGNTDASGNFLKR